MKKDYKQIGKFLDVHDPFVFGGHQIIKTAGATRHTQRVQNTPAWTKNDAEVRKLLKTSFPKLEEDSPVGRKQRILAARWLRFIYLYHRVGWTANKIAAEMEISMGVLKNIRNHINRVYRGLNASGRPKSSSGPGRPRKS